MEHPKDIKDRYLRLPEVIRRSGLSRSSIYAAIKENLFPRQVLLGKRSVGWLESEIENWIHTRSRAMS